MESTQKAEREKEAELLRLRQKKMEEAMEFNRKMIMNKQNQLANKILTGLSNFTMLSLSLTILKK